MISEYISEYLTPFLLILTGVYLKFTKSNYDFGKYKKRWYVFLLLGLGLLSLKIIKLYT
ncbi:MAG: hypothetical protein HRT66_01620 [Flavobacteriaceae bacterium]|nr:hypothetical protein [Flavobacteriaceae bacterium]